MDVSLTTRPLPYFAIGSSSGNYNTTSGTYTAVCTVTITATGRPIHVLLQNDGAGTPSFFGIFGGATNSAGDFQVTRNGTMVLESNVAVINVGGYILIPPGSVALFDPNPGVGSVTYSFNVRAQTGGATWYARWVALAAHEI